MPPLINKEVLTNSLHLILERGGKLVLSLLVGVYVIRYLGPDRYGLLSYLLSLAGLLIPFANLGYTTVVVKEIVSSPDDEPGILGAAFGLNVVGAAVVFVLLNLVAAFWLPAETGWLLSILSLRVLFSPVAVVDAYFQSVVRARYPVLARSTAQLLSAGLRLLAIFMVAGLVWFVAIQSFVAFVSAALLVYCYLAYGRGKLREWHVDRTAARRILLLSLPLVLTNLFNVVILRIDQVIIKQLLDDTETGIYAAAATLSEAWYFLPGALLASLFPALVRLSNTDPTAYFDQLTRLCALFAYLALAIAVGFYFVGDWAIPWLLGEDYARSTGVLAIHVWAGVFVFLGRPVTKALIIADLNRHYLVMRILAAATNIGLNYLLIPRYGINGAAWATLVAYAVAHVLSYALFRSTRPYFRVQLAALVWPWRKLWGWLFHPNSA